VVHACWSSGSLRLRVSERQQTDALDKEKRAVIAASRLDNERRPNHPQNPSVVKKMPLHAKENEITLDAFVRPLVAPCDRLCC
jgi:hypothetical protein